MSTFVIPDCLAKLHFGINLNVFFIVLLKAKSTDFPTKKKENKGIKQMNVRQKQGQDLPSKDCSP